jgi:copper chaperone CopZ
MKEYTFKVPSMHDETSAKDVRSAIVGIRGIEDVNINFEDGIVNVYYDENQVVVDKIKYVVQNKGYSVSKPY